MSDTPRTDKAEGIYGRTDCCHKDFARQLERELNELLEWRKGQKGIEDYYRVKENRDRWRVCAAKLAASLRSELRGEDARYTDGGQPCALMDLAGYDLLNNLALHSNGERDSK